MQFVKVTGGVAVPYTLEQLRADNPDTAFPRLPSEASLEGMGVFPLYDTSPPTPEPGQVVEPATPVSEGRRWKQAWNVRSRTSQELDELETRLLARIDREAGAERLKYITDAPGQAMTYQAKAAEAEAYANDPGGTYPLLEAEAEACGIPMADLAAEVTATAAQWTAMAANIEAARMKAKRAVRDAATYAGKEEAALIDWAAI